MFDQIPQNPQGAVPPNGPSPIQPPPMPNPLGGFPTPSAPAPNQVPTQNPTASAEPEDIFSQTEKGTMGGVVNPGNYANPNFGQPVSPGDLFGKKPFPLKNLVIGLVALVIILAAVGIGYFAFTFFSASLKQPVTPIVNKEVNNEPVNNSTGLDPNLAPTSTAVTATTTTTTTEVINDTAKDTDGDGLTDAEERELGTDVNNFDSDTDGLTDRAEVKIYKTNPLNPDTDGDGHKDGAEVINGYDPLKGNGAKLFEVPKK